jgi:hypothetical protein
MCEQTLEDNYDEMALFWQPNERFKQQSPVINEDTEDNFKVLLRILFTLYQKLLPSFILVIGPYMPGHSDIPAEYTLQWIVESFSNQHFQLAEYNLTHP